MNTLTEVESMCSRIFSVVEHDDLRSSTLVTLSAMLARLRSDLEHRLADWRAVEGEVPAAHEDACLCRCLHATSSVY